MNDRLLSCIVLGRSNVRGVGDHGRDVGRIAIRVRDHPGGADVVDIADGALAFLLQLAAAGLKAMGTARAPG